jgi:hypothetical protein
MFPQVLIIASGIMVKAVKLTTIKNLQLVNSLQEARQTLSTLI